MTQDLCRFQYKVKHTMKTFSLHKSFPEVALLLETCYCFTLEIIYLVHTQNLPKTNISFPLMRTGTIVCENFLNVFSRYINDLKKEKSYENVQERILVCQNWFYVDFNHLTSTVVLIKYSIFSCCS